MLRLRLVVPLVLGLLAPRVVAAQTPQSCQQITLACSSGACTAVSIASGAFTTDAFNGSGYRLLKVVGNLTDASNGVSLLAHTVTENFIATGQFEAYPYCSDQAPSLVCGALSAKWVPTTDGKNYTLWIPWRGRYGKITVTPTGNGSGDVLNLELYGCF